MAQTTSALDGMWLTGFVPQADHYGIYSDLDLVGFACVNDEGYVLQFYLQESLRDDAITIFKKLVGNQLSTRSSVHGAYCSTAEPQMLSYCFEAFSAFEVDTLMYRAAAEAPLQVIEDRSLQMTSLAETHLHDAVTFAHNNAGGDLNWLRDYLSNLIMRQELFGYFVNGDLLATGECRGYDKYQLEYADLGVIVAAAHRQQGIATQVLKFLKAYADSQSLIPICSTEKRNVASQTAISRAGFVPVHRIVKFTGPVE